MRRFLHHSFLKGIATFGLLFSLVANADTYMWIDNDGRKHYGDRVPTEYKDTAVKIGAKSTNTVELKSTNESNARVLDKRDDHRSGNSAFSKTGAGSSGNGVNCEEKKRAYQASRTCFSSCQQIMADRDGNIRGSNNANCGHCRDLKRPNC